jgi:hypothetical protein
MATGSGLGLRGVKWSHVGENQVVPTYWEATQLPTSTLAAFPALPALVRVAGFAGITPLSIVERAVAAPLQIRQFIEDRNHTVDVVFLYLFFRPRRWKGSRKHRCRMMCSNLHRAKFATAILVHEEERGSGLVPVKDLKTLFKRDLRRSGAGRDVAAVV